MEAVGPLGRPPKRNCHRYPRRKRRFAPAFLKVFSNVLQIVCLVFRLFQSVLDIEFRSKYFFSIVLGSSEINWAFHYLDACSWKTRVGLTSNRISNFKRHQKYNLLFEKFFEQNIRLQTKRATTPSGGQRKSYIIPSNVIRQSLSNKRTIQFNYHHALGVSAKSAQSSLLFARKNPYRPPFSEIFPVMP